MISPFADTGAPPLQQPELVTLRTQFRLQGDPLVRWVPRETQGGGFGNPDDHPYAWGVWAMADGQWRRVTSARGLPREWTSLDRVETWLRGLGFTTFSVMRDESDPAP